MDLSINDCYSPNVHWIWSDTEIYGAWWMFRKSFFIPKLRVESAKLLVTSGYYHEVYINGELIARGAPRSYDFEKSYDVIEVTSCFTAGIENIIAVLSPRMKQEAVSHDLNPVTSGVLAEIFIILSDGQELIISTDSTWRVKQHLSFKSGMPWMAIPLGFEECFNSNKEYRGWYTTGYDDSNWNKVQ